MTDITLDKALLNLISDPYDKDNCFYGHILAQCIINIDNKFDGIAGVGYWNDNFHLVVNPNRIEIFTLNEQKAILVHEAMHILFNHVQRKKNKARFAWNLATDAAINQFIPNLPKGCIYPETLGYERGKYAEYYYEASSSSNQNRVQACEHFKTLDSHKLWQSSESENDEEMQKKVSTVIKQACEKSIGHLPFPAKKALELLEEKSKTHWQRELKKIMSNSIKYYEPSYKKVNRRFPNRLDLPGKKSVYMPALVCVIDVSGSMSNQEIASGLIEIEKICRITRHKFIAIQVDTMVHDISKIEFKEHQFVRKGSGGTDLYPALEYIKEHNLRHDILVFITDGGFSFGSWKEMPKAPMFFLITDKKMIDLPTKKSRQIKLVSGL